MRSLRHSATLVAYHLGTNIKNILVTFPREQTKQRGRDNNVLDDVKAALSASFAIVHNTYGLHQSFLNNFIFFLPVAVCLTIAIWTHPL